LIGAALRGLNHRHTACSLLQIVDWDQKLSRVKDRRRYAVYYRIVRGVDVIRLTFDIELFPSIATRPCPGTADVLVAVCDDT